MGLDAALSRLADRLHAVLAPRAERSPASYRIPGEERELASAFEEMQARSGIRMRGANGRFAVTAPPSAGGSFRRTFSGESIKTPQGLVLRGEYSSDMFAAAFFGFMFICLACSGLGIILAAVGNMLFGDLSEGRGILLSAIAIVPFAGFLALIYRAAAHGGLASQDLIHEELTRLEEKASGSASHGA